MISKQELQFVNDYARHAPYPGNDYAYTVINKIAAAIEIFNKKYDGKKYSLILSNGEELTFEIKKKNLAHLLGIDFKLLSTSEYMKPLVESILGIDLNIPMNSYTILTRIVENGDKVIQNDSNNFNKFLNYFKVMIKASCFDKLSDFSEFNFGFINFDRDTYQNFVGSEFSPLSTKYIFSSNDEALIPYCMMGLKKDNETDIMIPETFIAPTDFANYLVDQVLLVPIQILINDGQNLSKIRATSEEKIRILNLYKSLIIQYNTGSLVDIYNDYETLLREDVASIKKSLIKK